jgi:hypothetical protein
VDDEISYGPKREFRLPTPPGPPGLWKAAAIVAALIVATGVFAANRLGGSRMGSAPRASAAVATLGLTGPPLLPAPGPPPYPLVAAQGTMLIGCDPAVSELLAPHWRDRSLRIGPLWFVAARKLGYVRAGRASGAGLTSAGRAAAAGTAPDRDVRVLVHVDAGPVVVLRAAAETWPHFKFLGGQAGAEASRYPPPTVRGLTFVPCPRAGAAPADTVGFYQFDFSIAAGYSAAVEVLTSSGRHTWLTFTAGAEN